MRKRLVSGRVLYTDSTHLKANANKNKHIKVEAKQSSRSYLNDLENAINEDRLAHGKKPLAPPSKEPSTREIKQSTTDKDSGYMVRDGKPKGFFYLDHRTVDGKCNIITDVHVTPGNVHDSIPYLDRIDRQKSRFNFNIEAVGLDAGYFTAAICKGLEDRDLFGAISYRRPNHKQGYFYKREYKFDAANDEYICPAGERLIYKTTSREGYRHYESNPEVCRHCEHLNKCTKNSKHKKTVTRHVWEDFKERSTEKRLSLAGKQIYKRRKETVERSFADAKELHGYRYAKYRGLTKVTGQCLLAAAAQNMKKIALMAA
jgi:IS5 family transposase